MKTKNKKGQMSIFLILLILFAIVAAIFLFVGGVIVINIDEALDRDIDIGQVNLRDINDDTFGIYTQTFLDQADWWGLSVIFGTIMGLLISSFVARGRFPKWGMILDIIIILTFFIASVYVSNTYNTLLDALATAGETFLEEYTPRTSNFIAYLPVYELIIGVLCMILFHSSIPRRKESVPGGFVAT